MPRNTRNFWLTASADGIQTPVSIGPRSKDGHLEATVKIRENGAISDMELVIHGHPDGDGGLVLEVYTEENGKRNVLGRIKTQR
jgi:hypothetical protein